MNFKKIILSDIYICYLVFYPIDNSVLNIERTLQMQVIVVSLCDDTSILSKNILQWEMNEVDKSTNQNNIKTHCNMQFLTLWNNKTTFGIGD